MRLGLLRGRPSKRNELMPRERQLPFGVAAGIPLGEISRVLQRYFTIQMGDEMRHAMRAHDRQRGVKAALAKRCCLLQCAGLEHALEPRVDPCLQGLSFSREEDRENIFRVEKRRLPAWHEMIRGFSRSPRKLRVHAVCAGDHSAAIAPRLADHGASDWHGG